MPPSGHPCRRRCPVADASFLVPPSLHVQAPLLGDDGVTIRALSEATDVHCPVCGEATDRVHTRYARTLADLPWARFAVCLRVEVRKSFCDNPACPRTGAPPPAPRTSPRR